MDRIGERELADLVKATAKAHHDAFEKGDGFDPDWAIWYAGHLQASLGDRLGSIPTRAELTYLLVGADRAYRAADEATRGHWPGFYARFVLEQYRGT